MGFAPRTWRLAIVALALCGPTRVPALELTVRGTPVALDLTAGLREVFEADRGVTRDRTLVWTRVRATVAAASWLRAHATTLLANGGPTMLATQAGVYDWTDVFQELSPSVDFEEAYVDASLAAVDVRVGKQKLAWGQLDRTQPNDLINPRSYLDPFLQDESEQKLGVPAVQASYYLPRHWRLPEQSRLTAVWVPRYLPYRFPRAGCTLADGTSRCGIERWFPPAAVPPVTFVLPPLAPGQAPFVVPLSFDVRNEALPAWQLENSSIGLRYSALVRGADVAAYLQHGFDVHPAFQLTAEALGEPDPTSPAPVQVTNLRGATHVAPAFAKITAWGADVSFATGPATVRAEAAFIHGRPFSPDLRRLVSDPAPIVAQVPEILQKLAAGAGSVPVALPPSVVERDAVEWGVGGDWTWAGFVALLQLNQTNVLANDTELLIKDTEARLLGSLRKSVWSDTLQAQVVGVYGLSSDYTMLRPRLRYRLTDAITAEVGYLFLAGRTNSVLGQFKHNDQGWLRLEWRV